ncbi:MAG: putative lipid II flippase FtsW [Bdellovibrionota bacterium]
MRIQRSSFKELGIRGSVAQRMDTLILVGVVAAMVAFGLLMVFSSSFIYAQERMGDGFAFIERQVFYAIAGGIALAVFSRVDYRRWGEWAFPLLVLSTVLLIIVAIPGLGTRVGGARRWIKAGFLSFQPAELAKFAVIFFTAFQLFRKQGRLHTITAGVLSHFIVPLPALILLLIQPDFGSIVIICAVVFSLLYLAGVPKRYLFASLFVAIMVGLWLVMGSAYRKGRMTAFLDPWGDPGGKGFQLLQSLVGLHEGGFLGVGLGNGKEKLFYLPEAHNDFIFAVIGEELGFLGVLAVVAAYLYFVYCGLRISWRSIGLFGDSFGMLLGSGITLSIGAQGLINMAVVLGLVPTKGLTLPFISYGGSALVVDLAAVGVLLSIARGPDCAEKQHETEKIKPFKESNNVVASQ